MAEIIRIKDSQEILDIVDGEGIPTGETVSRAEAHRKGIRHRTSHVWLIRERGGRFEVLLQKRAPGKDSYPGCYDISSAGHIPAGVDFADSAVRELEEELGVRAKTTDLILCGRREFSFTDVFHGEEFRDCQVSNVYVLICDADEDRYILQESEISEVKWFDFEECKSLVETNAVPHCIYMEELDMVERGGRKALAKNRQFRLIDAAARGNIDAAADLAEGYLKGSFGEAPNPAKGLKWARYAAKRGSQKAASLLGTN